MKEKDLHKIIRDNGGRDNTLLVDALKSCNPELTTAKAQARNRHSRKFKRLAAVFAALAAAEAVALILIPTLLLSGGNSSLPPTGSITTPPLHNYYWWGSQVGYTYHTETMLHYSIQEYNELYDTDFLFFSTVDYDYRLYEYREEVTEDFLCLQAGFKYTYYEEWIGYAVCPRYVTIGYLSYEIMVCTNESVVSDCLVKWGTSSGTAYGIFSYDNYDYYISVGDSTTNATYYKARLFELIQDLLPSQE